MRATIFIYFLSSILLIQCIPIFDYYDQNYEEYDERNNIDSLNLNITDIESRDYNNTQNLDLNNNENVEVNNSDYMDFNNTTENSTDNQEVEKYSIAFSNGTAKDLYVIRTIIYEIGILSSPDESNNSSSSSETQDQIDISLFKPTKEELIDETKIPELIKGRVDDLTNSALRSLDVVPLIEISTKNKSSTEIRQLSLFPNSFVRLTANISTIRADSFNQNEDVTKIPI